VNLESIHHAVEVSGWILYLMAVLLLVALTVAIERSWYLRKVINQGSQVMGEIEAVPRVEEKMLGHLGEDYAWLPHAKVLKIALQYDLNHNFDRISDKLEEAVMREAPGIDRYLWILDTIVTMAPLLGLLGTIIGMFNSFQVLGDPGNVPTKVTGGVAEALLATASGLFIAIIGLFFFNALNNRVRVIMHQLETLKVMLVNRMYPYYCEAEEQRKNSVVTDLRSRAV
jgi:biopolymer transport protein ExbB